MTNLPPLSAQQEAAVKHGTHGLTKEQFEDRFWSAKYQEWKAGRTAEGHRVAVVKGVFYTLLPTTPGQRMFLGFGGRNFTFSFEGGNVIQCNNVWHNGEIPLRWRKVITDNADILPETDRFRSAFLDGHVVVQSPQGPPATAKAAIMRQISAWPVRMFRVDWLFRSRRGTGAVDDPVPEGYSVLDSLEDREETTDPDLADAYSSEIASGPNAGLHIVAIDLDENALLIPSSTPGHHHLIIDHPMEWEVAEDLLVAMTRAGLVETGYLQASIARRATHLRVPWMHKGHENEARRNAQQREYDRIVAGVDGVTTFLRYDDMGWPHAVSKEEHTDPNWGRS